MPMGPFYRPPADLLFLVVRQLLHVLLEDLLVLRGEIVDRPPARQHRLADARRQIAPAARAVALGAELVDRLAGAVRIVGLGRGTSGLRRRLGLPGLRLLRRPRPG